MDRYGVRFQLFRAICCAISRHISPREREAQSGELPALEHASAVGIKGCTPDAPHYTSDGTTAIVPGEGQGRR